VFAFGKSFYPFLIFEGKARAYPKCTLIALLTNIGLAW